MPETKWRPLPFTEFEKAVSAPADSGAFATPADGDQHGERQAWQRLIDHTLIEWGRNPSPFDEDVESPSKETIALAVKIGQILMRANIPAPSNIVPDAHGGIVFERRENDVLESYRVSASKQFEYCLFKNAHLIQRDIVDYPAAVRN